MNFNRLSPKLEQIKILSDRKVASSPQSRKSNKSKFGNNSPIDYSLTFGIKEDNLENRYGAKEDDPTRNALSDKNFS